MSSPADRARLRVDIANAARVIAPVWPAERFVAVNPLLGLVDRGFDAAVAEARRWLGARGYPGAAPHHRAARTALEARSTETAARVDDLVARWCARLCGERRSTGSVFDAWRVIAADDRDFRRLAGGRRPTALPSVDAADAVLRGLADLAAADPVAELRGQLARLPGWAGYARWCDEWATADDPAPRLGLLELLAIRLTADVVALRALAPGTAGDAGDEPAAPPPDEGRAALVAAEARYRGALLGRLAAAGPPSGEPPAAQVVCCIDVRSEPLRRHLEAAGAYETFGFAGFFAAAVQYRPYGSNEAYPSAPVLVAPDLHVVEIARPASAAAVVAVDRRRRERLAAVGAAGATGHGPLSMFAFAEVAGWALGPLALARTVRPRLRSGGAPSPADTGVDTGRIPLDERATMVEALLRVIGLTDRFAPVVVVCGHRATSTNNPHAAALDCGACGGNPGGANARILTALANEPDVRAELGRRGVEVPEGTWFVAAEHDTTLDTVTLLDATTAPAGHQPQLWRLAVDLDRAARAVSVERLAALPATRRRERHPARRRAADWAETRPEWGLAGNAAMVIGPRRLTRGVDLAGRVFLQSYEPDRDDDGTALETILTAPLVVAHWINAQYYFSTVDPEVYGAGDKAVHNPIPGVGVLGGDGGDLRIGLPWQSIAGPDEPYHEPLRLLAVVAAPVARIEAVVDRNPILQHLLDGEWIHLLAVTDHERDWHERRPGGTWHPVRPTDPELRAGDQR